MNEIPLKALFKKWPNPTLGMQKQSSFKQQINFSMNKNITQTSECASFFETVKDTYKIIVKTSCV